MTFRIAFAVVAATLVAAAPILAGDAPQTTQIHGLKLSSPIELSLPEPAGLDAVRVVHPPGSKPGSEKLSLTAAAFPKDSGTSDAELLDYVKTTFLATSTIGTPVERTFLGTRVTGNAFEKKIPAPSRAEIYVVTKKDGDKVVLGFVFIPGFAPEAERAIAGIAATLKE